MPLSAKRSLLLLPGDPPPEAARTLALLQAAARRLEVPAVSANSPNWRVALATGRSQVVAAGLLSEPEITRLPPGTQVFLVIDCLAERAQPAPETWGTMAATPVTAEMVVFEWLERGATDAFRDIIGLIK
ncbi:MAG: hypothetical protein ACFB13_20665 [Kiloniellaceae bacterium]